MLRTAMAATYDNLGIQFLYPENWKIVDETGDDWPRGVSVESPGGSFWSVQISPPPVELEELLAAALKTYQDEYEGLEAVRNDAPISGLDSLGYDICFFYLDLLVQVRIRCFLLGVRRIVNIFQAEDGEFNQFERVFYALTESLVRSARGKIPKT